MTKWGRLYFVQVDQKARRAADFLAAYEDLLALLDQTGFALDEIWAGEPALLLRVIAEPLDRTLREATLDEVLAHPLVASVWGNAAAIFALTDRQAFRRYGAADPIPEARLRGYREKLRDFRPNVAADHTGEIIVRYLEEKTIDADRLSAATARIAAIHERFGATFVSRSTDERGLTESVTPAEANRFVDTLQAYLDSEDVEFAQPNYVYRLRSTPNDPFYVSGALWGLNKISGPGAWSLRSSAHDVVVAVLDTGIDHLHQDLAATMWINGASGVGGVARRGVATIERCRFALNDHARRTSPP